MIVVKVGGSLFDVPTLGPGLRQYLSMLGMPTLLVPGGGGVANAVRSLDRTHALGEETSHWIALRALSVTADFLRCLIGNGTQAEVLDVYSFASQDDRSPDALPHAWAVTSDSLAARVALVKGASRLILLKSVDIPATASWKEAADRGGVDSYFPSLAAKAPFPIEALNFRKWLDANGFPSEAPAHPISR